MWKQLLKIQGAVWKNYPLRRMLRKSWGSLENEASPHTAPSQCATNFASPAEKDGVINCAEQIQLTNMRAYLLVGFVRHSWLQALSAGYGTLDILCVWKEITLACPCPLWSHITRTTGVCRFTFIGSRGYPVLPINVSWFTLSGHTKRTVKLCKKWNSYCNNLKWKRWQNFSNDKKDTSVVHFIS